MLTPFTGPGHGVPAKSIHCSKVREIWKKKKKRRNNKNHLLVFRSAGVIDVRQTQKNAGDSSGNVLPRWSDKGFTRSLDDVGEVHTRVRRARSRRLSFAKRLGRARGQLRSRGHGSDVVRLPPCVCDRRGQTRKWIIVRINCGHLIFVDKKRVSFCLLCGLSRDEIP